MAVASSGSTLVGLPHELLHQILFLLSPSDLASLCRASRRLREYISHSEHLWIQIYKHTWDTPQHGLIDAIVSQPCPRTQLLSRQKGKRRCIDSEQQASPSTASKESDPVFLDRIFAYPSSNDFDIKEQVQRRVWAEKRLANLRAKPIDLYANYNETMRTLLSIARSRKLRRQTADGSGSSSSSIYLKHLLTSPAGMDTFHSVVYPRTDVRRLRLWQDQVLHERHCKSRPASTAQVASAREATNGRSEKRTRTSSNVSSNVSSTKEDKRRKTTNGPTPLTRRRSKRLLLHSYPQEVHHLLFDDEGNSVIDTGEEVGLSALEELDLIDEQLAAELHVLHGILPGMKSRARREQANISQRGEERAESEAESSLNGSDSDWDEGEEDSVGFRGLVPIDCEGHDEPNGWQTTHETAAQLRGRAREIVYDNARYGVENDFGPWRAWRERWELIDGERFEQFEAPMTTGNLTDEDGEEEEEGEEGEEEEEEEEGGEEVEIIDETAGSDGTPAAEGGRDAIADGTIVDETSQADHEEDVDAGANVHHPMRDLLSGSGGSELDDDEEDDEDFDEDFDMQDEDDMDEEVIQMRARDIAYSHGLFPYYESERLQYAAECFKIKLPSPGSASLQDPPDLCDEATQLRTVRQCKALVDVWRIEKAVDWIIVESVMVCMHANISHAVQKHGWGRAVRQLLPGYRSDFHGGLPDAEQINPSRHSRLQEEKKWRDYLTLPYGWSHSRGDASMTPPPSPVPGLQRSPKDKPFDWAAVESTWIGTYAFLDWSRWALFNSRSPDKRCWTNEYISTDPTKPPPRVNTSEMHRLQNEPEALGDCLQLQMELLPMSEQKATSLKDRSLEWLQGAPSSKYPPLRFRGRTVTLDEVPARPRGQIHGMVRPIFAPAGDDFHQRQDASPDERAIVALEWTLTHSYEGDERWSLSGVQPGPPGTRAPIYGIWGSSQRNDDLSPHGGFVYYRPGYVSQ